MGPLIGGDFYSCYGQQWGFLWHQTDDMIGAEMVMCLRLGWESWVKCMVANVFDQIRTTCLNVLLS